MNKYAKRKAVLEARKAEKKLHKFQYPRLVHTKVDQEGGSKPVLLPAVEWHYRFPLRKDAVFNKDADVVLDKSKTPTSYTRVPLI